MPGAVIDPVKAMTVLNLVDTGMTGSKAAEMVGISESAASQIIRGHGRWGEVAERSVFVALRQQQKAHLQAASIVVAAKALIQVENTIDKASAYQAAGIYGLLRANDRLDAGESTQNIAVHTTLDLVSLDKLSEMLGQALMTNDVIEPEK
jgi:predicted transcriptional regulator